MTSIETLRRDFGGKIVEPGGAEYESASCTMLAWGRPAYVLRPTSVADVQAGIRFAASAGLVLSVRGGGHAFPGFGTNDGGVVIDLGPMKGIRVDPGTRRVRAQAGVLLGDLDRETQAFGLAVPAGIVTHTGLAGLTLGGGIGWQQRKHGLSIDNLLSVDLVTADGEFEVFWRLRE